MATSRLDDTAACQLEPELVDGDTLLLRLAGRWTLDAHPPLAATVLERWHGGLTISRLAFDAAGVAAWDSGLVIFLRSLTADAGRRGITVDPAGLPEGIRRLLALAAAVPERRDTGGARRASFLAALGIATLEGVRGARDFLAFLGEASVSVLRLATGRARFQRAELFLTVQEVGAQALPIVSLISFLVGVILAYVGALQLRQFGAQVYVADLVGIAMTREMGAMMAAIIMAGRTGAAFAAQLGTMQVNEEIDALSTLGINAMEFLVLPRMLALALMMPLLGVYADLLGILGGAAVGLGMLDLGALEYSQRTLAAVGTDDFLAGLVKASVFGVLVAIAGCLRGMQCGRSSAAVGAAATSAVVTGIVLIIVSDAIMTVIFDLLGL
jgi:phospholipid/cholesterol/gamma-HCH transport system permease protein